MTTLVTWIAECKYVRIHVNIKSEYQVNVMRYFVMSDYNTFIYHEFFNESLTHCVRDKMADDIFKHIFRNENV